MMMKSTESVARMIVLLTKIMIFLVPLWGGFFYLGQMNERSDQQAATEERIVTNLGLLTNVVAELSRTSEMTTYRIKQLEGSREYESVYAKHIKDLRD